jgi:diguanylate cyclase (GGDEF)-like protein
MASKVAEPNVACKITRFGLTQKFTQTYLVFAAISVLLVGIIDFITGPDYTFALIYSVPVFFVSWLSDSKFAAFGIVILTTLVWSCVDFLSARINVGVLISIWNIASRLVLFLLVIYILHTLKLALRREHELSRIDTLTQVYNLRAFQEISEHELMRCRRNHAPCTLAFIDMDNFKQVNDTHGHEAGDALLVAIAEAIRANLRESDLLARLGGDEFALFLAECDEVAAREVSKKIKKSCMKVCDEFPNVSVSIGVLTYKSSLPTSIGVLMKACDQQMNSVKKSGKNNVAFAVQ